MVLFMTSAFFKRDWFDPKFAKVSWLGLCSIGAVFSIIVGSAASLFIYKWDSSYNTNLTLYTFFILEAVTVCAYHAIVASWSDLIFRKVNRSMLVIHMGLQAVVTIVVCAIIPGAGYLITPTLVGALLCWLSGLIPGGGMSDGRMLSLYCLALLPLFQTSLWMPILAVMVLAIIWAIIVNIAVNKIKTVKLAVAVMKTMFPVAPLLAPCMVVFTILYPLLGQVIPFLVTTGILM